MNIRKNGNYIQYGPKTIPGLLNGQNLKLLGYKDYEVSTTSTSAEQIESFIVKNVSIGDTILINTFDTEGRRENHFVGTLQLTKIKAVGGGQTLVTLSMADNNGAWVTSSTSYGIYITSPTLSANKLTMLVYSRYSSTYTKTVDGTYRVEVYKVEL